MDIYLDFDGTMVVHKYPEVGVPNPLAIEVVKELQEHHRIVLNTYRANIGRLDEAVNYLKNSGIRLDEVLPKKDMPPRWDLNYFEAVNRIYIDDASPDTPMLNKPLMVNWKRVKFELQTKGWL